MISHRDYGQKLTDPITLSFDPYTGKIDEMALEAIKSALTIRYRLLPYLYTLFFNDNQNGDMVLRPLFAEFPEDSKTYRIDKQYFWGSALMISPVTELGMKSVKAYFPKGNWYSIFSLHFSIRFSI
jgi:lysosomal alpha-glucosidase